MPLLPELSAMINGGVELLALGALLILGAAVLGYLSDRWPGVLYVVSSVPIIPLICLAGYFLFGLAGGFLRPPEQLSARLARVQNWADAGLVAAVVIVAVVAYTTGSDWSTSRQGQKRGSTLLLGLWLHFCVAAWIGHVAAGVLGILTITFPAVVVFWLALFWFARCILPLDTQQQVRTAFRCLATYSCGRNYPYYRIEDRELALQVHGAKAKPALAGPGIVLTGPDHAVAVSSGLEFKGIRGPGTVFTGRGESILEPVDLRIQQRTFECEAATRDGIRLNLTVVGSFQLDCGDSSPALGHPFPLRISSAYRALRARPMDIVRREEPDGEVIETRALRRWDELYELTGKHVIQDVISQYQFDELLYDPDKSSENPRSEINRLYRRQMTHELRETGIRFLKGDVGNLMPSKREAVFERRIQNWQAQWQQKMLQKLGMAEADIQRMRLQAEAEAQTEMIQIVGEAISDVSHTTGGTVMHSVILRFINSLSTMITQPDIRSHLPPEVPRTVKGLPHIIGDSR